MLQRAISTTQFVRARRQTWDGAFYWFCFSFKKKSFSALNRAYQISAIIAEVRASTQNQNTLLSKLQELYFHKNILLQKNTK